MHTKPIQAGVDACKSTVAQDIADQRVVLGYVLALHPTHVTIPDLVRAITNSSEDFAEGDALERAVRDLTGVGLLHCPGGVVEPTQAAICFYRLDHA